MSATTVLPVSSLIYPVGVSDSFVVLSSSATTTNDVGTVTSLTTSAQVRIGYGLWVDQELMKVLEAFSDPLGVKYRVMRGVGGSAAQAHSSTAQVTIGSLDKFYSRDPKGRPADVVLVSPWINTANGSVWMPQGDSYPANSVRWWQNVSSTYGIGPLGVRTSTSSPSYGT